MAWLLGLWRGLRVALVLWLLTVVVITLPLLGLARLVAPDAALGSLLNREGRVVGSRWIGQPFRSARYLNGRPAGGANLPPGDPALRSRVATASERWGRLGLDRPAPDLLQDSGSGVDPHISLAAARQQLPQLARERSLPLSALETLLRQNLEGIWGLRAVEPVVNVLRFNLALDALAPVPSASSPPL
ncbi:MAG: potassium-transporting ATPase subunit C [Cyanobacteriota bacterium]|nr:potassium-transporting ATPase subunit C [Cyanobacteriota bacterium]